MHHKVGVGRSYPCRCLRLKLHDVSAGEQWDGVSGVRKLANGDSAGEPEGSAEGVTRSERAAPCGGVHARSLSMGEHMYTYSVGVLRTE